ncbi:hypothetical protein RvY_06760 [Ramazzottius varieornatus]|uniref:Uncharacterized protein n=1 Tax=Ramazzottius varieornatus TaxID=947166 RepID=A0A1D1V8D0_RAMVA|nr:hypothetical protein RvY_06760 [Ramazzottius varieornatus]
MRDGDAFNSHATFEVVLKAYQNETAQLFSVGRPKKLKATASDDPRKKQPNLSKTTIQHSMLNDCNALFMEVLDAIVERLYEK